MAASSNSVTYSHHPSSSQKPPSFGSTSAPTTWDVFVSFCGEDTRYNFTSYLYDKLVGYGIRTFMDDPELRIGEIITDALIQAINDSKIYVVVFSENYAFSPWCLDELVEIYKCYENMNRLVIGVYYNIDPSVVRHQKESFGKAFEKHEAGHFVGKMERVNNWRKTLKNVADFSGKHISAKSRYTPNSDMKFNIGNAEFPEWISKASGLGGSTLVLDFPVNVLQNSLFLGIILCCNFDNYHNNNNIKNTAKDIIWSYDFVSSFGSKMVIVPRSKLSLTDEDHTIELTVKGGSIDGVKIHAILLLYND